MRRQHTTGFSCSFVTAITKPQISQRGRLASARGLSPAGIDLFALLSDSLSQTAISEKAASAICSVWLQWPAIKLLLSRSIRAARRSRILQPELDRPTLRNPEDPQDLGDAHCSAGADDLCPHSRTSPACRHRSPHPLITPSSFRCGTKNGAVFVLKSRTYN